MKTQNFGTSATADSGRGASFNRMSGIQAVLLALSILVSPGCKDGNTPADSDTETDTDTPVVWECLLSDPPPAIADRPPSLPQLGCQGDFNALAADPLDASIPGAKSMKTVVDRTDDNKLYFTNTERYPIHWDFASANLSIGQGFPVVGDLGTFNQTEYYSPERRFILGAITYYEEPQVWAWELSPYDTASAEMIEIAYRQIKDNAFFGADLKFHPTSTTIEIVAQDLPSDVQIISTDELFAGITYQPLNLATSMGRLSFKTIADLEAASPDFREIVVLEEVPLDLSATAGIITQQFQTPLSHINVLSQNRGTPNMGLRGAFSDPTLRALEGKWVELVTGAFEYSIREVTQEDADAWWEQHRPDPIDIDPMDTSVHGLVDLQDALDFDTYPVLGDALSDAVHRFGGKGSHYAALTGIPHLPVPPGFLIPVYWYDKHMRDNHLYEIVDEMLADPHFQGDPAVRVQRLAELRAAIAAAPIDPALETMVIDKIMSGPYVTSRFRFRSSTNAEDVAGFNGAGLYDSRTGDPLDPARPVRDAMRRVWSSVWSNRAFEERSYYSINHRNIGMALLCHRSFPTEDSNGVAITANIFDSAGVEPAFYVNVQVGDFPVVRPDPDKSTDQILYYYTQPGQPIVYLANSSEVAEGETVLTANEVHTLGGALADIHTYFQSTYGGGSFYGMDVEFKFDSQFDTTSTLYIKQARPYPGYGLVSN